MTATAEAVIAGAGIAGIAAAYHLAVRGGMGDVVIVDERPPLTLTSDKSTECYRNWWPGPDDAMVALMNRSIDLLEELAGESGNHFRMNRRGYVFATADPAHLSRLIAAARQAESLGAGPLRVHAGAAGDDYQPAASDNQPTASDDHPAARDYQPAAADGFDTPLTGADLLTDPALVRRHFPYLAEDTVAVLHARRCGWFSGQQLGMHLLERARERGVRLVEGRLTRIETEGGRVGGVELATAGGLLRVGTPRVVLAVGPFLARAARELLGLDLPVFCEQHAKIAFSDTLRAVPREAPLLIWADPVRLAWSDDERAELAASPSHRRVLDVLPAGVHGRPEGGADSPWLLGLWTFDLEPVEPIFPMRFDPAYPELVLRGMARMIPALGGYLARLPTAVVDGGYYAKTRENRCLAGPLPVEGAYVIGALSGYGLMAASGAADLLAAYICDRPLPAYAPAFRLDRYDDPRYVKLLDGWADTGQL
jgi:sarcosine oxidase, subunit beta